MSQCAKVSSSGDRHSVILSEGEVMQEFTNKETGATLAGVGSTMLLTTPNSSVIDAVFYGIQAHVLYVVFNSGKEYRYTEVPMAVFMNAINADSVGAWFNSEVKNEYAGEFHRDYATL